MGWWKCHTFEPVSETIQQQKTGSPLPQKQSVLLMSMGGLAQVLASQTLEETWAELSYIEYKLNSKILIIMMCFCKISLQFELCFAMFLPQLSFSSTCNLLNSWSFGQWMKVSAKCLRWTRYLGYKFLPVPMGLLAPCVRTRINLVTCSPKNPSRNMLCTCLQHHP